MMRRNQHLFTAVQIHSDNLSLCEQVCKLLYGRPLCFVVWLLEADENDNH